MKTIGIRVTPKKVFFAILDTELGSICNVEALKIPLALEAPEALKYIRNHILDVLREYGVVKAGIKITEPNSKWLSIPRIEIEGVIQETFASSNLEAFYTGQISSISAKIGIPRTDFKKYVEGELIFAGIEGWERFKKEEREAILSAVGAESV